MSRGTAINRIILAFSLTLSADALAQSGVDWSLLRTKAVQVHLNLLVGYIEEYKIQHGAYPESLALLKASLPRTPVAITDPPGLSRIGQPQSFFYSVVGTEHYYLRSLGEDGRAFTSDDILPQINPATSSPPGLLLSPPL
jgi:hypothetical protein